MTPAEQASFFAPVCGAWYPNPPCCTLPEHADGPHWDAYRQVQWPQGRKREMLPPWKRIPRHLRCQMCGSRAAHEVEAPPGHFELVCEGCYEQAMDDGCTAFDAANGWRLRTSWKPWLLHSFRPLGNYLHRRHNQRFFP